MPAVTHDFLPTILDVLGVASDHPTWELDGVSLMPFITESVAEIPRSRAKPIGFWWGGAQVWIDNDLKIVQGSLSPGQGCVAEAPWAGANASDVLPLLFNLTADHTESVDLKGSSGLAPRFAQMQQVSTTACTRQLCFSRERFQLTSTAVV